MSQRTTLSVGSLFSGIGGLDLGLERAGMTVRWQSEIDPYACRVLAKHWPDVPNLGDITTIDWSNVEPVDLICGGYPCQPFSFAGVRRGEGDPRHLWPHFADALRVLRPRYALLENVPGHLSLGFGRVLGDLAELGFDADWDCIPAAAVGAPHLRYRIFVVAERADTNGGGLEVGTQLDSEPLEDSTDRDPRRRHADRLRDEVADTDSEGLSRGSGQAGRRPCSARRVEPERLGDSLARVRADPRGHWASEPDVGRVAHGVPRRVDRLRALGNAVVPQVAEFVGHRIMEAAA